MECTRADSRLSLLSWICVPLCSLSAAGEKVVALSSAPGNCAHPTIHLLCAISPGILAVYPCARGRGQEVVVSRIFFFSDNPRLVFFAIGRSVACSQCSWSSLCPAASLSQSLLFRFSFFFYSRKARCQVPLPLNFRWPTSSWWDRFLEISSSSGFKWREGTPFLAHELQ